MIVAIPAVTPVTRPDEVGIVAVAVLLLLQVPPDVALVSDVVAASQTLAVPAIAAGSDATFTEIERKQPGETKYVIVAAPADTPVTMPLADPTEAMAELLLVQVPPETT